MKHRLVCLMGLGLALGVNAQAQSLDKPLQLASREPAFYAIVGSHLERAEARNVAALRTRVALRLHNATIPEALKAIEVQTALRFAFKPSNLPADAMVSLDANDITVAAALTQILMDADVDVEITPEALASLVSRHSLPTGRDSTGTIIGQVIDSKTRHGIPYAAVSLDGTARTATANDSGGFRMTRVKPGTYTVVSRRIGYVTCHQSIVVTADQVTNVQCAMDQSPNELDRVVVTSSVVPTEVKALPTPITVISDSDIAEMQPHSINELFRQYVPTGVSWDQPQAPYFSGMSTRGSSSLFGSGYMKVFIDGVETNSPAASPVDPSSIDHIEVIRGPEAVAVYGSGAVDGVLEIFTKHGADGLTHPQFDLQSAVGDVQTPYAGFRNVLRQQYTGEVRGGTQNASYSIGGSYNRTDNYEPLGEYSAMSTPSVHGGVHYMQGLVTFDLSGRYYDIFAPEVSNPLVFSAGVPYYAKPAWFSNEYLYGTIGTTIAVAPTSWLRSAFTLGYDMNSDDDVQRKPRLTSPGDSLLVVASSTSSKTSLAFNTSISGRIVPNVTGSVTVGADHWVWPQFQSSTGGAFNVRGPIRTDPGSPISDYRVSEWNTGLFAQAQVGFFDALFLTIGGRAEWNPNWGDSIGVPISPRFGASYTHAFVTTSFKLRASWGSALNPPPSGTAATVVQPGIIYLGNPHLGPEHQRGGDAGFDLVFGDRGSFSATYFNQDAINLIQLVQLRSDTIQTDQYQNVGEVRNLGVELEGSLRVWRLTFHANYGYDRSRVIALAPGYQGDLRINDQPFDIPKNTAGASVALRPWRGATVSTGLTYVGSWTDYDNLGELHCLANLSPDNLACPPSLFTTGSLRGFLISYPSFVKGNLHFEQQIGRLWSAFVNIDNIGDNEAYEINNTNPAFGRITMVGVRVHN